MNQTPRPAARSSLRLARMAGAALGLLAATMVLASPAAAETVVVPEHAPGDTVQCLGSDGELTEFQVWDEVAGGNYAFTLWEEKQDVLATLQKDKIDIMLTWNFDMPTWQAGTSLRIHSSEWEDDKFWGMTAPHWEYVNSSDKVNEGCGLVWDSGATSAKAAEVKILGAVSGLEYQASQTLSVLKHVEASISASQTWSVSATMDPTGPKAEVSESTTVTFGMSGGMAWEDGSSVTLTSTNQPFSLKMVVGGKGILGALENLAECNPNPFAEVENNVENLNGCFGYDFGTLDTVYEALAEPPSLDSGAIRDSALCAIGFLAGPLTETADDLSPLLPKVVQKQLSESLVETYEPPLVAGLMEALALSLQPGNGAISTPPSGLECLPG